MTLSVFSESVVNVYMQSKGGDKNMTKKKFVFPSIIAIAIIAITLMSANYVSAQEGVVNRPIVQRLAEKFNLDTNEVQKVFDEERETRQAERYALFVEKLDDLVAEGKLTQEQKDYLVAHHEKMQGVHEEMITLEPSERREKAQSLHSELEVWAESQNLDLSEIMPFQGRVMHGAGNGMMKARFGNKL